MELEINSVENVDKQYRIGKKVEQVSRKLYKLALWYIRKCHATDRNYRQEVEKMEWLTYKNCGKAHLIYGLGAEWESVGRYEVIDNAIQRLWEYENKQSEQPKAEWIPCEERLPSEYGQYLYTDKNDEVHEGCYCPQYHGMISGWSTCEATGFTHLSDYEVIAWQPLPKPYKKEGAE